MCPLLSDDSQASHTPPPPSPLPFSNLSLPPHLSPFQPVPYLLNPASVTALNAKALPRQMIKVSSQFTLQCIDLMFPNLPGLSLMLPRTFGIFYTVPLFPGFTLYPSPSPAACACARTCARAASATKKTVDRDVSPAAFAYESSLYSIWFRNGQLKMKDSTQSSVATHERPTASKLPSLLQHNYWPALTCCFKYCFRVNHSLVLI